MLNCELNINLTCLNLARLKETFNSLPSMEPAVIFYDQEISSTLTGSQPMSIYERSSATHLVDQTALILLETLQQLKENGSLNISTLQEPISQLSQSSDSFQFKAKTYQHGLTDRRFYLTLAPGIQSLLADYKWLDWLDSVQIQAEVNKLLLISMTNTAVRLSSNLKQTPITAIALGPAVTTESPITTKKPAPTFLIKEGECLDLDTNIQKSYAITSQLETLFENIYNLIVKPNPELEQLTALATQSENLFQQFQQTFKCAEYFTRYNIQVEKHLPIINVKASWALTRIQLFSAILGNFGLTHQEKLQESALETFANFCQIRTKLENIMH